MNKFYKFLTCPKCGRKYPINEPVNLCVCGGPLLAKLNVAGNPPLKESSIDDIDSMWRYGKLLPVENEKAKVTLGEGWTPLNAYQELGDELGIEDLYLKDESVNPTGSFKDRGMSMAITRAKELGITKVALPSAGNAGVSAAAYSHSAGIECAVFMPDDTPSSFTDSCIEYGAHVELIKGDISDAAAAMTEILRDGWFNLSTLKEPYRIEGKKTMGYELAEQMDWRLPDVVIYPTGGGTGMIGMWKAFQELESFGWIGNKKPKMVSVQSEGCAPIVRAFEDGKSDAEFWQNADTKALGLRVPSAVGDFLILGAIRESGGIAIAVSEQEIDEGVNLTRKHSGIDPAPEAGAAVSAVKNLLKNRFLTGSEKVVVFITGSGEKYGML